MNGAVTFDSLRSLHAAWVVLAVAVIGVWGVWRRRQALLRFADAGLVERLAPRFSWTRGLTRRGLVTCTLLLLVAALLGPRWGAAEQTIARRNIDVVVLLDVSRSMLARDVAPSRLERAKLAVRDDLLPALGGDRIGLVTFAGVSRVKCPLTSDYGFYRLALDDVTTASSPRGGTLIGDAIRDAVAAFDEPLKTHKLIILMTDGEDHDSYAVAAARAAWDDQRIRIVTVGLGDAQEGARVPVAPDSGDFLTFEGKTVWSKADFTMLREIAAAAPDLNAFIPAGTRDFDLGQIYRTRVLPLIHHEEEKEQLTVPRPARHYPFVVAAFALLLIESLLRDGPRQPAVRLAAANGQREAA